MNKWFSGIRAKLLLVSVVAVISLFIVGGVGLFAINSLSEKLEVAYTERMELVDRLGQMEAGLHGTIRWLWVSYANDTDVKERQKFILKTKDTVKELEESIAGYLAIHRVTLLKSYSMKNLLLIGKTLKRLLMKL